MILVYQLSINCCCCCQSNYVDKTGEQRCLASSWRLYLFIVGLPIRCFDSEQFSIWHHSKDFCKQHCKKKNETKKKAATKSCFAKCYKQIFKYQGQHLHPKLSAAHSVSLWSLRAWKVPLLKKSHVEVRLKFANEHLCKPYTD